MSICAVIACIGVPRAAAATLAVCATACTYNDFQQALTAAQPGDTILLRAGETFVGNFVLPNKGADGPSIVIRSDAPATALPGVDTRLVPEGYDGGNTRHSALARLVGVGGGYKTTPVLQAAPGAHGYQLQFIDIDGVAQEGWETIVELGNNTWGQSTLGAVPTTIVLDRVFIHGHPTKGQKRCVGLNGADIEIRNSYIVGCTSFEVDAQAIAGFNGPGPFRIVNNHLEASGENVLFGGADPQISGLVPSDIEITRNHFIKPVAWRDPILLAPPISSTAVVTGGGSLGYVSQYFQIVAVLESASEIALSAPSAERRVSISGGDAVALTWNAVPGADRYRIYRGTSPGAENLYVETASAVTSLTYRGTNETAGTPPAAGTRWSVKNLLELKNAQRVLVDGNVFEQLWPASQQGYAILLTPRNEEGGAPWSVVRDVTLSNNIIRHVAGGIDILGTDDVRESQPTSGIAIRNNLVYDVSAVWGGASHFLLITRSPYSVKVDHNTIFHEGILVLADDGASYGFEFTNNVAPHNTYGIFGGGAGTGTSALDVYFPDALFRRNALGGGPASLYPADNLFPDMPTFTAQFLDAAAFDYRLVADSQFRGIGTDGADLGVDFSALSVATGGLVPTDGGGGDSGGSGGPATGGSGTSPFGGTPISLPGVVQAEDFDERGTGVAYFDTTAGNSGGQYRATDVDLETTTDSGGGYDVGWIRAGEWLNYTVNVSTAGTYTLEARVAASGAGATFHIEVGGVDKTGPLTIPDTGGWQSWTTISKTGVSVSAGQQVWRLVVDSVGAEGVGGNINYLRVTAATTGATGSSSPFGSAPYALPGRVQAEDFDQGGQGVGYRDLTSGNTGGVYRNTDVDIGATTDTGGGYRLGWIDAGEWLNYTVNVDTAGTYDFEARVASNGAGGTFHIEVNGVDKTGPLTIPKTGGWQTWMTIRRTGVSLGAGVQVWRVVMDAVGETGAVGNINWFGVTSPAGGGGTGSAPYSGTAVTLPGTIEAENFDTGGTGVAYRDLTSGNTGGAYRNTDVDIGTATDTGGGYRLGWIDAGEWLNYTVNVSASASYDIEARVASNGSGGTFHIEVNGVNKTGPLTIPNTGGWQTWTTIRRTGVSLSAGVQVWRVVMDTVGATGAVGNINAFFVRSTSTSSGSEIVLYASDVTTVAGNGAILRRCGCWRGAALADRHDVSAARQPRGLLRVRSFELGLDE